MAATKTPRRRIHAAGPPVKRRVGRRQERILMCTTVSVTMVTRLHTCGWWWVCVQRRCTRRRRRRRCRWTGQPPPSLRAIGVVGPAKSGARQTRPIVLYLLIRLAVASSRTRRTAVAVAAAAESRETPRTPSHTHTHRSRAFLDFYFLFFHLYIFIIFFFFCFCARAVVIAVIRSQSGMWCNRRSNNTCLMCRLCVCVCTPV